MNDRDEQWYRRELDRVTKERDRARHERKEMRAIVRQQTAAYECLRAERDRLSRFNAAANDALSLLMEGCVEAATQKGLEALNMIHEEGV